MVSGGVCPAAGAGASSGCFWNATSAAAWLDSLACPTSGAGADVDATPLAARGNLKGGGMAGEDTCPPEKGAGAGLLENVGGGTICDGDAQATHG